MCACIYVYVAIVFWSWEEITFVLGYFLNFKPKTRDTIFFHDLIEQCKLSDEKNIAQISITEINNSKLQTLCVALD